MKFLFNGIKVNGKLYRAHYSLSTSGLEVGTIAVYARDYGAMPCEVQMAFAVRNATDLYTDYFEKDSFRVPQTHPLYYAVFAAYSKQEERNEKWAAKRKAKLEARAA